jgi:four helix bundle protein
MDEQRERETVGDRSPIKVSSYEDLVVWQKAMVLVRQVYHLSSRFPSDERFGLTSQIRRAAVSIPSNLAEGHERRTTRDFIRFVSDAEGSLAEVNTQLRIALDLEYCSCDTTDSTFRLIIEIKRMLHALRRSLSARERSQNAPSR